MTAMLLLLAWWWLQVDKDDARELEVSNHIIDTNTVAVFPGMQVVLRTRHPLFTLPCFVPVHR